MTALNPNFLVSKNNLRHIGRRRSVKEIGFWIHSWTHFVSLFSNSRQRFCEQNKQDGRLPPAYFGLPIFVKKRLLKRGKHFFSKKHFFFIVFFKFSNVQSFLFFWPKASKLDGEVIFRKKYHLRRILQRFSHP